MTIKSLLLTNSVPTLFFSVMPYHFRYLLILFSFFFMHVQGLLTHITANSPAYDWLHRSFLSGFFTLHLYFLMLCRGVHVRLNLLPSCTIKKNNTFFVKNECVMRLFESDLFVL